MWRPQDHLAHLAYWRDRYARVIDAVRTGGEVPPEGDEEQNKRAMEEMRDESVADVVARANRSWDLFQQVLEDCSEDDLVRPHPHRPDRPLVDGLIGDHLGTHIFWCQMEAGNEREAEAILRWAQDLSARISDEPRSRGVGNYNLACFYARTERADEALSLLEKAFEDAPDVREWAREDPDLEPIRDDPRVRKLLAG